MNPPPLVPYIPDNAPFSTEQRAWLNGLLAGMFSRTGAAPAAAPAARPMSPLTILFGSQTGTAEGLAKRAAKEAGKRGFAPTVLDMAQTSATKLAAEKNLLIITSTYGEGEPPDNAKALHAALHAEGAPLFAGVRYSVCALGDRNYAQFCQCGRDFDQLLHKLGATRALPHAECDVDYEEMFLKWLDASLGALGQNAAVPAAPAPAESTETSAEGLSGYSRQNPFPAPVLAVRRLSGAGSAKEVNHVEFSLEDSGLLYDVGDALGVYPQNCPELVAAVLAALQCDGEEAVPTPEGELPLRAALLKHFDLGKPAPDLLKQFTTVAAGSAVTSGQGNFLDVLDVLQAHPGRTLPPLDFVRALRKLQPRLYSIASSPAAHLGQVHLTVGAVRYESAGRPRKGVCSTFLAERAHSHGRVGVFVHRNKAFKPPVEGARAMIMVGPGTGIAPFRAFLHERRVTGATGKNWLFFGDQHAAHDYLYRDELEGFHRDGALHRLDTAFSRDQEQKIYVQHRLRDQAAEIFRWLEEGAHFYVCGDAARMAKDVDAALREIVQTEGKLSDDAAGAYLDRLRAEKRYARDVY
ncbi:MAG TPA: sulfite reductase subunit alpha [Opitutales bacterium]|nr:sulfite reductase subunit alpha [Opitutales bacterium]